MADLKSLLAELGGDSPQNKTIAEGLQKQGINSLKDIQVQKVDVPGYAYGSDESAGYMPDTTRNVYFNKRTGAEVNPTRLGIYQVDKDGKAQGDIFFHLNADDQGNVKFEPEWSPRAHGFLRDNPIGQLIMKAGAIIPSPAQPFFVAANVGDALAHEKYAKALLAAAPYAFQQLGGMDAIKNAVGFGGPSGLDMGDVIPAGGIAQFAPNEIAQLTANTLAAPDYQAIAALNPMGLPSAYTGAVDYIPLNAINQTANLVNLPSGVADGSPLDVSLADQTFQKIINPLDTDVPIDSMTARSIADSFYNPNGTLSNTVGIDDLDDLINSKGVETFDELTKGTLNQPSELTTTNVNDTTSLYPNADPNNPNTVLDPKKDFMGRPINDAMKSGLAEPSQSSVSDWSKDMMGRPINDSLTLDKVLDLGGAYLQNPAALAGLVGTGLAATGLVNNVIGGNKVVDTKATDSGAALTSKPIPSMVTVGSTPGLQDLFNYADLYKSSPFLQTQTTQQQAQPTAQIPSFIVSDVFKNLMADAGSQPKIEPTLVGLADLQKKMMVGK
jgi:hypothetical protein